MLELLRTFAKQVGRAYEGVAHGQPEDQLKRPTAQFLEQVGNQFGFQVQTRTEVRAADGRPDIGAVVGVLLCGYVELKAPGEVVNPERMRGRNKTQWKKFQALPNLIYTNGQEWRLFRTGEQIGSTVRFASDPSSDGENAVTAADAEAIEPLIQAFLQWEPLVPHQPRELAEFLAPLCRLLRDDVREAVRRRGSTLTALRNELRAFLMPDLSDEQFSDAYAQALTYALLLARLEGANDLSPLAASRQLMARNTLLQRLLTILAQEEAYQDVRLGLEILQRAIRAIDPADLRRRGGDLWLYFYEDFLRAYDPNLARDFGVYYTPVEVVRCQIRLISHLLSERFGKRYTFADEGVTVLDPGAGTGTYLVAAIRHAIEHIRAVEGAGAVPARATRLAQNLIGFEILIGPYAVAHLRLSRELTGEEAEGTLPEVGLRFFLTDTLDSPHTHPPGGLEHVLTHRRLVQERERARRVKAEERVIVCLGNPPYDRHPADEDDPRGGWVRYGDEGQETSVFDDFTAPARRAGRGVHLKNLYNLYVYFWRWALWKVFEPEPSRPSQSGIVSFITASSYLVGPGFVGMREYMRRCFDEMWIINLGGDNLGARKEPNVFNIQTPVAIAVGVRTQNGISNQPAIIRYARISGSTRDNKLEQLEAVQSFADLDWQDCPEDWQEPFLPGREGTYFDWPQLRNLFPWQHSGVQFKRTWPIAPTREVLTERWRELLRFPETEQDHAFHRSRDRNIYGEYDDGLPGAEEPCIADLDADAPAPTAIRYGYRSFDRQWALFDTRLGDYLKRSLWETLGPEQLFMTTLLTHNLGHGSAATVTANIPDLHHFRGSFGGADILPLWRDSEGLRPNVTHGLLEILQEVYGDNVRPGDLFAYIYGTLCNLSYTQQFWNELETPGTRVPLTRRADLFERMVQLGRRLIWLHTYGTRMRPQAEDTGIPPGSARALRPVPNNEAGYPETFDYVPDRWELRVGEGTFGPVSREVWNYEVSGLFIVKSWLDYRKKSGFGRRTSPLNAIHPHRWTDSLNTELLELLSVLEHTIAMEPELKETLNRIIAGPCFQESELPTPTPQERRPPRTGRGGGTLL